MMPAESSRDNPNPETRAEGEHARRMSHRHADPGAGAGADDAGKATGPAVGRAHASGAIEIGPGVRVPKSALRYTASRSSGPGGQNVNKLNTRIELRISVDDLATHGGMSHAAVTRLRREAGKRITDDDELIIVSSEHRSQNRNKSTCLERLRALIVQALVKPKIRRATKPSRASVERRLEYKRRRSRIKQSRSQRPSQDG
jgi:ribosome-associated protein